MESPVRIKTGLCVLFGLLLLVPVNKGFPKDALTRNIIDSDDAPEESALNVVTAKTGDVASRFQPRNNTWLYQRRNMTNILPSTTTNSNSQPAETTPNYGNKITFRGSVKYFATRPPFKPKTPFLKRNSTKNDSSEKSEEKIKVPSVSKANITETKLPYRRRNSTVSKNISSESSTIVNTTSLPIKEENTEKLSEINLPKDFTTTTVKYNEKVNRTDSGKSFNFDFNIDKYTSADFHDVNNVYSPSVSPEIERFVVPSSVSDYFVHVGSDSYPRYDYRSPTNKDLTTPHTDYFDKRFKEVSESIKQNLEEASQEDMSVTENYFEETPSSTMNFEDLLARRNEDNATIMFKNTKELIFTDSKDAQSMHGEYTDINGTKMYFEMSSVTTEKYPTSTKEDNVLLNIKNKNENLDTSTLQSIASNEVLNNISKPNITKRIDLRNNGTRKQFLTTIRMRTPTTPKPKMRILIRNNTTNKSNVNDTKETASTTRSTPYVRVSPILRRRNTTGTTVPSKIDPIYQLDNSPTRISNTDNTIPTLNKRGSSKYFETSSNTNNTSNTKDSNDAQFSLPPTATAWALVSMKNTPVSKKANNTLTNGSVRLTKTEEELQKLDKITSGFVPMYQHVPTISTASFNMEDITDDDDSYEDGDEQDVATSATKFNYTMILRPTVIAKLNHTLKEDEMQEKAEETKTSFESITKFPDTVTTPLYDSTSDSTMIDFTSEEASYPTENDLFNPMTGDIEFSSMSKLKDDESTTIIDEEFSTEVATELFDDFKGTTENYSNEEKTTVINLSTKSGNQVPSSSTNKQNIDMMSSDSINQITTEIPTTENDLKTTTVVDSTTEDRLETTTYPNIKTTYYDGIFSSRNYDDTKFSTEETPTTTQTLSSVYTSTFISKSGINDIYSASTVYYSPSNGRTEVSTPYITTESHSSLPTEIKSSTHTNLFNSEENVESREGKKNTLVINEDNGLTTNDEEWIEAPDPTSNMKQFVSNEIPLISNNQNNSENDLSDINLGDNFNANDKPEVTSTPSTPSTTDSIIEVIERETVGIMANNEESTTLYLDDMGGKYESSVADSGAVAAITISVIGVIALLLIVGLLIIVRGRKRSGGYGQRCTPVSLDSYSLDNVSVTGSMRRKGRGPSKRSYGNPAYDESGATSHPMQFAALANFALDQDSIVNEFNEIPTITAKADEVPPGCEAKNRYSNVIPLPETRVILKTQPGDDTSDYINANYVRGPKSMKNYYIACQAPLASTVNDFWRMIWEQNSRVILMLTELMENGTEKCFEYLPPSEVSDSRRSFGDYQVVLKKREVRDKYVISTIQLKSLTTNVWREVTHLWYFWPAKGVPDECNSIIAFLIEARSYLKASQSAKDYDQDGQDSSASPNGSSAVQQVDQDDNSNGDSDVHVYNVKKSEQQIKNGAAKNGGYSDNTEGRKKSGPLVIHCSPGTGRTGTLIACDIGIRDFEMSRTVDVPKTVYRIRRDRANAVQTKDQYIFIYKVLSEYATKLTGGILDSI